MAPDRRVCRYYRLEKLLILCLHPRCRGSILRRVYVTNLLSQVGSLCRFEAVFLGKLQRNLGSRTPCFNSSVTSCWRRRRRRSGSACRGESSASTPGAWGDPRWQSQGIRIAFLASQEEERVKVLEEASRKGRDLSRSQESSALSKSARL